MEVRAWENVSLLPSHGEARPALPLVPQGDSREDGPGLVSDLFDLTYVSNGLDELAPALPVLGMSVC